MLYLHLISTPEVFHEISLNIYNDDYIIILRLFLNRLPLCQNWFCKIIQAWFLKYIFVAAAIQRAIENGTSPKDDDDTVVLRRRDRKRDLSIDSSDTWTLRDNSDNRLSCKFSFFIYPRDFAVFPFSKNK